MIPTAAEPAGAGIGGAATAAMAISDVSSVAANAKLFELAHGLYALSIGAARGAPADLAGIAMPVTQIARPSGGGGDGVEILVGSADHAGWLGPEGGTVVVKSPTAGGPVLITTYRLLDQAADPLEIKITRVDRPTDHAPEPAPARSDPVPSKTSKVPAGNGTRQRRAPTDPSPHDVKAEIVLHVERRGDCRFMAGEWTGERGKKLRIEAFSIRPLEKLSPADIEYKAFGPNGRETPWVTDGRLCGTRGRGMPLTGFAVRLAPQQSGQYDVVYQGAFFDSGVAGPRRNGEACTPSRIDDHLEAVNIRLIERTGP